MFWRQLCDFSRWQVFLLCMLTGQCRKIKTITVAFAINAERNTFWNNDETQA
jgi:hypothetical protein